MEIRAHIIEYTSDAELKMKLGETEIRGSLADFGEIIVVSANLTAHLINYVTIQL